MTGMHSSFWVLMLWHKFQMSSHTQCSVHCSVEVSRTSQPALPSQVRGGVIQRPRVTGTKASGQAFHLSHGEGAAAVRVVDGHVQARAEEVLVHLRIEAGRQERAMAGQRALSRAQHVRRQAARQLHLVLDVPVLWV